MDVRSYELCITRTCTCTCVWPMCFFTEQFGYTCPRCLNHLCHFRAVIESLSESESDARSPDVKKRLFRHMVCCCMHVYDATTQKARVVYFLCTYNWWWREMCLWQWRWVCMCILLFFQYCLIIHVTVQTRLHMKSIHQCMLWKPSSRRFWIYRKCPIGIR